MPSSITSFVLNYLMKLTLLGSSCQMSPPSPLLPIGLHEIVSCFIVAISKTITKTFCIFLRKCDFCLKCCFCVQLLDIFSKAFSLHNSIYSRPSPLPLGLLILMFSSREWKVRNVPCSMKNEIRRKKTFCEIYIAKVYYCDPVSCLIDSVAHI